MKTVQSVLILLLIATTSSSQVPILSSFPSAPATVYLDFDGQYISGTSWNWNGDIDAQPAALSPAAIIEIFNRVAEDYSIFQLNVTTDSTAYLSASPKQRIRIMITPTNSWYGSAGGVSFVGSFTWGDDTPAWVFSQLLNNNIKYIAEAISHETGHTLGLQHQSVYDMNCHKIAEYAAGQGNGEIGWAPIMGVAYYKNLTTWHNGKSSIGCNYLQDDIKVISTNNGFGLKTDDFGGVTDQALDVTLNGSNFNIDGMINNAADQDIFRINIPYDANFRLIAIPQNVGASNSGADVDIKLTLLDAMADTIASYNPTDLLSAGLDTVLNRGIYYVLCEGVGNGNTSDYGSIGRYNLAGNLSIPLPIHFINLTGTVSNNLDLLSWSFQTDEAIKEFEIQISGNGVQFRKLLSVGSSKFSAAYNAPVNVKTFYRVKAITGESGLSYYSNIISLPAKLKIRPVKLLSSIVTEKISLYSTANCAYQLIMQNGQLIAKGNINTGLNNVSVPANVKGILLLRIIEVNEVWTEKILKQ